MATFHPSGPESTKSPPAKAAGPAPARKLNLTAIWIVSALVIALAFFAGMMPRWKARQAIRAESAEQDFSYVTVIKASPSTNAPALVLPLEIQPYIDAPIYARASGYLKKYYADIGQEVKEGDLLAEIDTPELDRQIEQSRAEMAQAEASLELAKTTAERWQALLKTESVSQQETAEKVSQLATGSAKVDATRANLRRLEKLQSFKQVLAPFDGTVTQRRIDLGELIDAGAARLMFRMAQTRKLRGFVRVPQASASLIAIGGAAALSFLENPGKSYSAKVVRTAGVIEADSRTLLTEVEIDNAKAEIVAGAFAEIRFQMPANKATLIVPANTLLFRPEGPQVGVVGEGGKVELRKVTLGKDYGAKLEVLSGITSADPVILNPSDSLVSGEIVHIAQPEQKSK